MIDREREVGEEGGSRVAWGDGETEDMPSSGLFRCHGAVLDMGRLQNLSIVTGPGAIRTKLVAPLSVLIRFHYSSLFFSLLLALTVKMQTQLQGRKIRQSRN